MTTFEEGGTIEAGLVGSESFPEKMLLLGPAQSNVDCMMQVAGVAHRVSSSAVRSHMQKERAVRQLILEHTQLEWFTLLQISGCNRVHDMEQRMARWLLMVCDRLGDTLDLTHEYLAYMLGVRRSTVTIVAGRLQSAGMLTYHRGRIQIVNRSLLEDTACECYQVCRRFQREVLGS